jgi:hypothetical protein
MGVLVSLATLVRMVAFGFALGIIVGLYFGFGGSPDSGSAACTPNEHEVEHCAPHPKPPADSANFEAAP